MQKLRKLLILTMAVVATVTFAACGGAPEGSPAATDSAAPAPASGDYDKDAAVKAAQALVDSISQRDYQPVYDAMTAEMQQLLPVDKMKEGFDPVLDASGAFVEYTGAETDAVAQNGVDYIVVVVSAKYEKTTRVYTISFTKDGMKLGGLFMK